MATGIFEAFSVSHAAILNGTTGAEEADIYGVREGSVSVDSDSYDNTGDDAVLSNWFWFNYAEVTISSGYVPFNVIVAEPALAPRSYSGAVEGLGRFRADHGHHPVPRAVPADLVRRTDLQGRPGSELLGPCGCLAGRREGREPHREGDRSPAQLASRRRWLIYLSSSL
jgi:hypothetical protein